MPLRRNFKNHFALTGALSLIIIMSNNLFFPDSSSSDEAQRCAIMLFFGLVFWCSPHTRARHSPTRTLRIHRTTKVDDPQVAYMTRFTEPCQIGLDDNHHIRLSTPRPAGAACTRIRFIDTAKDLAEVGVSAVIDIPEPCIMYLDSDRRPVSAKRMRDTSAVAADAPVKRGRVDEAEDDDAYMSRIHREVEFTGRDLVAYIKALCAQEATMRDRSHRERFDAAMGSALLARYVK